MSDCTDGGDDALVRDRPPDLGIEKHWIYMLAVVLVRCARRRAVALVRLVPRDRAAP
jgi:hypothetical protein